MNLKLKKKLGESAYHKRKRGELKEAESWIISFRMAELICKQVDAALRKKHKYISPEDAITTKAFWCAHYAQMLVLAQLKSKFVIHGDCMKRIAFNYCVSEFASAYEKVVNSKNSINPFNKLKISKKEELEWKEERAKYNRRMAGEEPNDK